ncbi:MAG: hypothetical protein SGILL_009812 [Bacillariaceae sp.]
MKQLSSEYKSDIVQLWTFQEFNFVFCPEAFFSILRQEWTYPHGAAPNTWPFQVYYKMKSSEVMPMMLLQGEAWKTPRHTMQTHMFSPKAADSYQPGINRVVEDASLYLKSKSLSSSSPKAMSGDSVNQFLMNVSFEMLAQVLLDRRMGLVDIIVGDDGNAAAAAVDDEGRANNKAETDLFVSSAVDAFHALGYMLLKPPIIEDPRVLRTIFPVWREFEQSMEHVWDIGMRWLEQAEQDNSETAFVTKLATGQQGKMGRQERLVNLITLLQAGVDTTSNSLAWAVIELARRPEVQEKLRKELNETIPEGENYSRQQHKLPYLKAFMRELQRVSPAAGGNMRKLPFDVQAGDYVLKKNSMIMWNQSLYSNDPELVGGDPSEFRPERWLAYDKATADINAKDELDPRKPIPVDNKEYGVDMAPAPILSHPLMSTAFGVGPRMCVGARVANNEMYSFLSKIVRDFEISMDPPDQEVGTAVKLLNVPDPFPSIRFDPIEK